MTINGMTMKDTTLVVCSWGWPPDHGAKGTLRSSKAAGPSHRVGACSAGWPRSRCHRGAGSPRAWGHLCRVGEVDDGQVAIHGHHHDGVDAGEGKQVSEANQGSAEMAVEGPEDGYRWPPPRGPRRDLQQVSDEEVKDGRLVTCSS